MLRSENAKEKSKTEKEDRESVDEALQFDLVANAKNHQAKIGNARWVQKEGERTTNASIATLLRPSPTAFTTPVKIPAIRISPGP